MRGPACRCVSASAGSSTRESGPTCDHEGFRRLCRGPFNAIYQHVHPENAVGEGGLEPPHPFGHRNLNLIRAVTAGKRTC